MLEAPVNMLALGAVLDQWSDCDLAAMEEKSREEEEESNEEEEEYEEDLVHLDATPRHASLDMVLDWLMVEDWEHNWPLQEDWMESDHVGQPLHVEWMDKMGNTVGEHWT